MDTTKDDLCIRELRSFLSTCMLLTRDSRHMSQMKFANDLEIDRRSYLDIEHGKHLCCTLTLLRYLCYQCDDPVAVLTGCRRILDRYSVPLHPQSNALSKKAEEKEDVGS